MSGTVLKAKCEFCDKTAVEVSRDIIGDEVWINLECGHVIIKDTLTSQQAEEVEQIIIQSKDGRKPFPYQVSSTGKFLDDNGDEHIDSVHFLENADCNGLCLHEQGLGKTVIECILLKRNPQLLPALIVVKSGLRAQWFAEIFRWTGMIPQVISSSREVPEFDLFDVVIVSIDTLRILRPDIKQENPLDIHTAMQNILNKGGDGVRNFLDAGGDLKTMTLPSKMASKKQPKVIWTDKICARFKHIAVDESQKIKNPGSSRTQALRKIAALANDGKKARVICYSGTNIEKHAGEFFVTLNLTRPEMFPVQSTYQLKYCQVDNNGKIGGLKNPTYFKELTKDFIIRFKRDQVMKDLPKVFRQFRLAELGGSELQAYIKVVKEFMEASDDPEVNMSQTDILGYLSRMRHITGIAKVEAAMEFLEEFLLESERKIVVFLHHKQAAAILMAKLGQLCTEAALNQPLMLPGGLKLGEGSAIIEEFKKEGNRVLIASSLAAGEGYNMQFCSDCLFMERQWNPSAEEQCEGRFPRPRPDDPWPAGFKINAHYLIAAGTIDDFLTEIVEMKRANVANTLDAQEIQWDESSLHNQLATALREKGLRRWNL
jgi:SNF2 family DNA or RNA helicase